MPYSTITDRACYQPVIDLNNQTILITGGTGSFGKAFVRTVLHRYRPKKIIIFSRDEYKQHLLQQELGDHEAVRYFIGDVRNYDRLLMAMREVDYVVHAAAMKQVVASEYNPFECIATNVTGAENVVRAAIDCRIKRVVALSTDKAANPINLYGASKLASDKIFTSANAMSGTAGTRFSSVRYGNVFGSRGSVVEVFKDMLAAGKTELPVTHPEMTRFWITIEQGVDFVLSCMETMTGGEVFVPKIPSSTIMDLVEAMQPGTSVKEIGIRPGEKLHESLISADDARSTRDFGDRYVIEPTMSFWQRPDAHHLASDPVPEGFYYSSDHNSEKIGPEGIRELLIRTGHLEG